MNPKNNADRPQVALRQLASRQRAARKKYLRPLVEMPLYRAITHIEMLPLAKLKALNRAMESCTNTNCWWAEMEGTRHYLALVESWIAHRSRKKTASTKLRQPEGE